MWDRKKTFSKLSKNAARCKLCPAMANLPAVLSSKNGSINTDLLFVAEAPGRFGAGRTGIPFNGDRSGNNFEILLGHAGFNRKDIFITNAVLCNPLKSGNNRRPTTKEIENCSSFLQDLIDLIAPKVISTLGGVGLEAINRIFGTRYKLADVVARPLSVCEFRRFTIYSQLGSNNLLTTLPISKPPHADLFANFGDLQPAIICCHNLLTTLPMSKPRHRYFSPSHAWRTTQGAPSLGRLRASHASRAYCRDERTHSI